MTSIRGDSRNVLPCCFGVSKCPGQKEIGGSEEIRNEVIPDRPTHSIFAEDTFEQDLLLTEMESMIQELAAHTGPHRGKNHESLAPSY